MPPGIVIQIQGDGSNVQAALTAIREEMHQTKQAAEEAGGGLAQFGEMAKRALEFAGIYLGIRELKEGLQELVQGSMELGEQLAHLSQQTGISVANLSVLKYAAESNGISFEAMTTGFRKLSEAMLKAGEGQKESVLAFQRVGISTQQLKENSNDLWGVLNLLADRFATLPDGAVKSAEATQLLGRFGQQLIPILDQGSDGLELLRAKAQALGLVLDQDGIERMEGMHKAMVDVKGAAEGAALGFTEGLAPAVAGIAEAFSGAAQGMNAWKAIGEGVGATALAIAAAVGIAIRAIEGLKEGVYAIAGATQEVTGELRAHLEPLARDRQEGEASIARGKALLAESRAMTQEHNTQMQALGDQLNKAWQKMLAPPELGKEGGRATGSFEDPAGKGGKAPKEHGEGGIDRAATSLAEAMSQSQVAAVKAATEDALAALDVEHKQFLVSDAAYYTDKLKLQDQAFDAQLAALKSHQAELAGLEARQQGDQTLKRNAGGQSAEELGTARQILEVQSKIAEVEGQKAKAATEYKLAEAQAANAGELEILKQAAQIETERNQGITARLALLKYENELELQKAAVNYGSGSPQYGQVQQLGQIAAAKLQMQQADQQIAESEKQNQIQTQELQEKAAQGLIKKKDAQAQINALDKAEAELLRSLLPLYQQQAAYLGGNANDKAAEVQKTIGDLSNPKKNAKDDPGTQIADGLSKTVTSSLDQLSSSALKGKVNFTSMADSMIADIERIALKSLEEQAISPFFSSLFGGASGGGGLSGFLTGLLPGHAKGGPADGPSIVGEEGPELFVPNAPGNVVSNSTLKSMASSGGSQGPNVNFQVVNNSSQNVNARETGRSYDHESKQFIVHTVLEDLQQGGSLSGAIGGMGR